MVSFNARPTADDGGSFTTFTFVTTVYSPSQSNAVQPHSSSVSSRQERDVALPANAAPNADASGYGVPASPCAPSTSPISGRSVGPAANVSARVAGPSTQGSDVFVILQLVPTSRVVVTCHRCAVVVVEAVRAVPHGAAASSTGAHRRALSSVSDGAVGSAIPRCWAVWATASAVLAAPTTPTSPHRHTTTITTAVATHLQVALALAALAILRP